MIDYKDVQKYIEEQNNIKLERVQIQVLKAIIRGDKIFTTRGIGRSTLYNGYADYLKEKVGKMSDYHSDPDDFDSVFTIDMITNCKYYEDSFRTYFTPGDEELFNREYRCIW